MKKERVISEMRQLFGDLIVKRAQQTDPVELDLSASLMDRVHGGADALLVMSGNKPEQRRYVSELAYEVRLVLCMWMIDTSLAAKLIRTAYAMSTQVCR
jgi:hypothetical protein